jgi:hypothetical protein
MRALTGAVRTLTGALEAYLGVKTVHSGAKVSWRGNPKQDSKFRSYRGSLEGHTGGSHWAVKHSGPSWSSGDYPWVVIGAVVAQFWSQVSHLGVKAIASHGAQSQPELELEGYLRAIMAGCLSYWRLTLLEAISVLRWSKRFILELKGQSWEV